MADGESTPSSTGSGTKTAEQEIQEMLEAQMKAEAEAEAEAAAAAEVAAHAPASAPTEPSPAQSTAPAAGATGLKLISQSALEVARAVRSPDGPTRTMAFVFWLSLVGMAVTAVGAFRFLTSRPETVAYAPGAEAVKGAEHEAKVPAENSGEHGGGGEHEAKGEPGKKRSKLADLGEFSVELKPAEVGHAQFDTLNVAQIDLIVECDSEETCEYFGENVVQVRSQLTGILVATPRDQLLSMDGKRRVKNLIKDNLNSWIPKGKVINVYFAKLIVS